MSSISTNALQVLYKTGEYSDLTITCGDDIYRAHKCVVCTQSDYFKAGCDFKETASKPAVFELKEVEEADPEAMRCMMQYFYEGDYTTAAAGDTALSHAKVYKAALFFLVQGLKDLALYRLTHKAQRWDPQSLLIAIDEVYTSGVDDDMDNRIIGLLSKSTNLLHKEEARMIIVKHDLSYKILRGLVGVRLNLK